MSNCCCCQNELQGKVRQLTSIIVFKGDWTQVTLKHCIEKVTGVDSELFDPWEKICQDCEKELIIAYKFRQKVLQTKKAFKDDLESVVIGVSKKRPTTEFSPVKIIKSDELIEEDAPEDLGYQEIKDDEEMDIELEADEDIEESPEEEAPLEEEEYIEEEYLEDAIEEAIQQTPLSNQKQLPTTKNIDPVTPVDVNQPKMNAELDKAVRQRPGRGSTWDCTLCEYKTKHSKKDLKIHMLKTHFPEEMFIICEHCGKKCATYSELKAHTDKDHSEGRPGKAICAICGAGFPTGTKLHAHMLASHAEGDRVPCNMCDATFKTLTNLKLHQQSHQNSEEEVHECPVCAKTFRVSYYLTKHIQDVHSSNPKLYTCNECGQTAKSKKDLRLHLTRRHFPECKSYLCVDCGKMFETNHRLSDHIRSFHNREYRYSCEICDRKFIHPASLRIHKTTHSDITPFSCEECGASFKNAIYLSHHRKTHITTKEFACPQCPQMFKTKGYLQTHIRNCHPVAELHCSLCKTTYKNLIIYKNHIKMHNEGKSACTICGKTYASDNNLRLHRKNAHGLAGKAEIIGV